MVWIWFACRLCSCSSFGALAHVLPFIPFHVMGHFGAYRTNFIIGSLPPVFPLFLLIPRLVKQYHHAFNLCHNRNDRKNLILTKNIATRFEQPQQDPLSLDGATVKV